MAHTCAEPTINGRPLNSSPRSDAFLSNLQSFDRVTFVSHVNPDPDSLGCMLGLAHLVETKLDKSTRITRDGLISRAENRAMVELLKIDLVPIQEVEFEPNDAIVMVDSQPKTGRHTFSEEVPITCVIDHHDTPGDLEGIPFVDIRPTVGATCTLVYRYLTEQEVSIPTRIATALMYGIETEVNGYPREAGPLDDAALYALFPQANKDLLAEIRNARLPHSHFECLLQALQNSFIYDSLILSWVEKLPQPELAAEVADFMVRFEKVDWAVCAGVYNQQLILSLRSSLPNAQGGEILRRVVGDMGRAGGHDRRAGGCIPLSSTSSSAIEDVQRELRRRFLEALQIEECRGQRLVRLREMLSNLQS